jgi:hypothetical protein
LHPINIKRPEFGTFKHLYLDLLEHEEKFHGFFRMNIEYFYRLSQLVADEIRKQDKTPTAGGRFHLKNDM